MGTLEQSGGLFFSLLFTLFSVFLSTFLYLLWIFWKKHEETKAHWELHCLRSTFFYTHRPVGAINAFQTWPRAGPYSSGRRAGFGSSDEDLEGRARGLKAPWRRGVGTFGCSSFDGDLEACHGMLLALQPTELPPFTLSYLILSRASC